MTREEAQELIKKHGSQTRAAVAAGVSRHQVKNALDGGSRRPVGRPRGSVTGERVPSLPGRVPVPTAVVRSLKDFQNTYDLNTIVPKKVAAGFKQLGAGWLYEAEFAKAAGLTLKDLGTFRDSYADHIVVAGDNRRIWVGKKQVAEQMRAMV